MNQRFFVYFQKGKVFYSKLLIGVRNSEVNFLRDSVDWARNKCLFSLLTGVCIKWVKFKEKM